MMDSGQDRLLQFDRDLLSGKNICSSEGIFVNFPPSLKKDVYKRQTIEMWFDPQSIHVTESIAYAALALLLIGVMLLAWTQRSKIAKKS